MYCAYKGKKLSPKFFISIVGLQGRVWRRPDDTSVAISRIRLNLYGSLLPRLPFLKVADTVEIRAWALLSVQSLVGDWISVSQRTGFDASEFAATWRAEARFYQ